MSLVIIFEKVGILAGGAGVLKGNGDLDNEASAITTSFTKIRLLAILVLLGSSLSFVPKI